MTPDTHDYLLSVWKVVDRFDRHQISQTHGQILTNDLSVRPAN